jgi:CRP/FNR family transcriptional regulator
LIKHGRGAPDGVIRLASTKRVLAAELGTSSETLSRTFARLKAERLLEVTGNTLRVLDAAALEAHFRRLLGEG